MCYILIAKQLKRPSVNIEKQIRDILKEQSDRNSDGFFVKNGTEELRTLDDRIARPQLKEVSMDNLMVHFRMASAGKVSEGNVHGWQLGDWQFFHNGSVSDYITPRVQGRASEQEDTDSYLFFQDLYLFLQEINGRKDKQVERVIREIATNTNFFGRAALYNKQTDKMYLFGDFHIYCFGDSYIVISSASLNLNKSAEKKIHGFEFKYSNESIVGEQHVFGIGVVHNFSRPGFLYRYLGLLRESSYTPPTKPSVVPGNAPIPLACPTPSPYTKSQESEAPAYENPRAGERDEEELSNEFDIMMNNIDRAEETLAAQDEDIEIDPDAISNAEGVIQQFTPEEIDDAILEMLQDEFGYLGVEKSSGMEVFLDQTGIHDCYALCCAARKCRRRNELDGIEFHNLDKLSLPQDDGVVQIGEILKRRTNGK